MIPSIASILRRLRGAHLSLLIALDETGSVAKAADRMAMSQPAATKALREIEGTFGTQLFSRSSRGISPNDVGRCVIRGARRIRAELNEMRDEVTQILSGSGVRLSVGAVMGAIPTTLVAAVSELHRQVPNISVEVSEGTSANLLHMLDQRKLDIALARPGVSMHPDAYQFTPLQAEYLYLVVGRKSPLVGRKDLTLLKLQACRWLVFPSQMPMRSLLENAFSDADLAFPTNVIETDSTFVTMTFLTAHRDFVAIMPNTVADYLGATGQLHILPVSIRRKAEPYGLVMRSGSEVTAVMRMFVDACLANASTGSTKERAATTFI
ncbi:MAG: hypothetical protein JWR21_3749 [Herminiimonas sp.]|nr:hypothetical protein [Herminiimonas sp.]